jgi:hypothetical protein
MCSRKSRGRTPDWTEIAQFFVRGVVPDALLTAASDAFRREKEKKNKM